MDEKLEKAIQTANYMASLTSQKKLALEEFNQNLVYYYNGSSFTASRELINFLKGLVDAGSQTFIVLDDNNVPVEINDITDFSNKISNVYSTALQSYFLTYSELKKKRRVEDLVSL